MYMYYKHCIINVPDKGHKGAPTSTYLRFLTVLLETDRGTPKTWSNIIIWDIVQMYITQMYITCQVVQNTFHVQWYTYCYHAHVNLTWLKQISSLKFTATISKGLAATQVGHKGHSVAFQPRLHNKAEALIWIVDAPGNPYYTVLQDH